MIAPTNFDISLMHYSETSGDVKNLLDFTHRNIGDLRQFKNEKLHRAKQVIETVHASLRERKGIKEELLNLKAIDTHIPKPMRSKFLDMPGHGSIVQEVRELNSAFVPFLEFLVCYKSDFGLALQRMIESYNLILLMQFEGLQTTESEV